MKSVITIVVAFGFFGVTPALLGEDTALQKSLRESESAFAKSVAEGDRETFSSFIAEDATLLGGPGQAVHGREAIVAAWEPFFSEGGPRLKWEPSDSQVRPDGSFGKTRGPYWLTTLTKDGQMSSVQGTFMSVWLRQDDGSWKVVFDGGSAPCPNQP